MPQYTTNRVKAILAMNLYALITNFFNIANKTVVNENKTNIFDVLLLMNMVCMMVTFTIIMFSSDLSFVVPVCYRKMLLSRLFMGFGIQIVTIIGNTLVPITVYQTLSNTTPLWASLIGYVYAKEGITKLEMLSFVISFGGVLMITLSQARVKDDFTDVEAVDEETERLLFKDNDTMAGLIGCICALLVAFLNGVVSVQTRMMQDLSVVVSAFYVGVIASQSTLFWLAIEYIFWPDKESSSQYMRIFSLSKV